MSRWGPRVVGSSGAGMLVRAQVLSLMTSYPLRHWTAGELHEKLLRVATLEAIRRAISQLRSDQQIVTITRRGRGNGNESTYAALGHPSGYPAPQLEGE